MFRVVWPEALAENNQNTFLLRSSPPLLFNYTVSYSFGNYFRNYNMCPPPPNLLCSGVFYCFLSRLCLPAVVTLTLSLPCTLLLDCYSRSCWRCDIIAFAALVFIATQAPSSFCFRHSPLLPGSSHLHLDSLSFDLETFHGAFVVCEKFFPFISTSERFCPSFYYNICTYLREY